MVDSDFLDRMNSSLQPKKKGDLEVSILKGNDIQLSSHVPYGIPTRIPALDICLQRPGLPAGRVVEIYGYEQSGKSAACLAIAASVQRMGGIVYWIDAERAFMEDWARANSCDPARMAVCEADTVEAIFSIIEKGVNFLCDSDESPPCVFIVDSVTGVPSAESYEKGLQDKERVGSDSRAIRRCMRRVIGKIAESNALVLFINHQVANISANPFAQALSAGGHAIKFFSSVRLHMSRTGDITKTVNGRKRYRGIDVKFKITKNKVGHTGEKTAEAKLVETGFDLYENLFDAFLDTNVIQKKGNEYLFAPKEIPLRRSEWPTFIDEHTNGIDNAYKWFLEEAEDQGLITPYGINRDKPESKCESE